MMLRSTFAWMFILVMSSFGLQAQQGTNSLKAKPTERLLKQLQGLYNNRIESDTATSQLRAPQEFRIFRVMENKDKGYWLYWGWFSANMPDFPLEERLVEFVAQEGHTWTVRTYYIPQDQGFEREWEKREPFAKLDLARLDMDECMGQIKQSGNSIYWSSEPCRRRTSMLPFEFAKMDLTFEDGKLTSRSVFLQEDKQTEAFRHFEHRFQLVSRQNLNYPFDGAVEIKNN